MNFRVACLLVGFELAFAEVYNYGAGTGGPAPAAIPSGQPSAGSWSPLNDLNNLFTTPGAGGSSWTYVPSAWSGDPFGTNQAWMPTTPAWNPTNPLTWAPITNQAPTDTVSGFTRYNGNCQGNYLGAVTQLTLDACAAACLGTPACAGFSFNLRSSYPQCILKNAVCSSPDTNALFTFFARNGYTAPAPYYPGYAYPTYVPVGPPIAIPPYPSFPSYPSFPYPWGRAPYWKSANVRQFKRSGAPFYEMPANCSGPIMRGPYSANVEKCAEDCIAQKDCTGFSHDNAAESCVLHTGVCQSIQRSTQWTYFARGDRMSNDADAATQAIETEQAPLKPATKQPDYPSYNLSPMDLLNRFDQLNGNCPGNALGETMNMGLDECARLCLENSACFGFSFNMRVNRPEEFQCMLKRSGCFRPSESSPYRFFRRRMLNQASRVH